VDVGRYQIPSDCLNSDSTPTKLFNSAEHFIVCLYIQQSTTDTTREQTAVNPHARLSYDDALVGSAPRSHCATRLQLGVLWAGSYQLCLPQPEQCDRFPRDSMDVLGCGTRAPRRVSREFR
jgi:hypothetical protein